jgi:hypothetical protein
VRNISAVLIIFLLIPAWADAPNGTQLAVIDDHYSGGYIDAFPQESTIVHTYVASVQSSIAVQLGLQYGQGFLHPVTVRFTDGAPRVSENPYFYVVTRGSGDDFKQDLAVNVEAYAKLRSDPNRKSEDLRGGFRYAMTELMLNDLAAGDQDKALPLWLEEGTAVFASGTGEELLKNITRRMPKSRVRELTGDLNSPEPYLSPAESARYFLAIDFINSRGVLQTFLRDVTNGQSPADAVRHAFGFEWSTFESNVQDYSVKKLSEFAPSDEDLQKEHLHPSN